MFSERPKDYPILELEVGKLYRLTMPLVFKTFTTLDQDDPARSMVAAIRRLQYHRKLEPGHLLMYLGKKPDQFLKVRELFLTQESEVVVVLSHATESVATFVTKAVDKSPKI